MKLANNELINIWWCISFILEVDASLSVFLCITWRALVIFLYLSATFTAPPVPALLLRVPDEETCRPHAAALPEFLRGESAHCPAQSSVHPRPGYLSYCAVYGRWAGTQPADRTSTDSLRSQRVHNSKCKKWLFIIYQTIITSVEWFISDSHQYLLSVVWKLRQ